MMWSLLLFLIILGVPAFAQDRMPEIPANQLTEAQRKAAEEYSADRERVAKELGTEIPKGVNGPFVALLRSPGLMLPVNAIRDYLESKSVLPSKLKEFAILITARQWTQQFVWDAHYPLAIKAGLSPEVAKAVAEGRRPAGMSDDEATIYDFCIELQHNQSVSDATYAVALAKFGERGIIDMVGVNGFYTYVAMVINVAHTPLPKRSSAPTLAAFPR